LYFLDSNYHETIPNYHQTILNSRQTPMVPSNGSQQNAVTLKH